jgi:hypothetical protein
MAVPTGDLRNSCKIFVGNPEGKRPSGRPTLKIILKWMLGI